MHYLDFIESEKYDRYYIGQTSDLTIGPGLSGCAGTTGVRVPLNVLSNGVNKILDNINNKLPIPKPQFIIRN